VESKPAEAQTSAAYSAVHSKHRAALKRPSKDVAPPKEKESRRSSTKPPKPPRRLRLPVISVAALVALFSVGIYIFVVPLVYSEHAEPKAVLSALDSLRRTPSNENGLTIDARLTRLLETSRRVKNLVGYQGWTVEPIKGSKTRVLMVFSYQETGGVNYRAEWLADLVNNTFIPQTELATSLWNN